MQAVAASCQLITEGTRVAVAATGEEEEESSKAIMVFWKEGLLCLWGENKWVQQLEPQVSRAIAQLGSSYPPPAPKKRDSRHQMYEKEVARFGKKNCGVYHFARWVATGQHRVQEAVLSRDSLSTATNLETTRQFFVNIAP